MPVKPESFPKSLLALFLD